MERHQDLAAAIPDGNASVRPLVAHATQPVVRAGMGATVHPGAMAYYDQDQASYVSSHADLLALGLAGCVLIAMWFSEMRRSIAVGQKHQADFYNLKIVDLMREVQESGPDEDLAPMRNELMNMLSAAIGDLDRNKLSETSFQLFQSVWQAAMDEIRGREGATAMHRRPPSDGYVVTPAELNSPHASLARMLEPRSSGN